MLTLNVPETVFTLRLLLKALFRRLSFKLKFLNSSVAFFLLISDWYVEGFVNTVYENIFLVYVNILGFIGSNILSTESQKIVEIMRGWLQKI